VSKNYITCYNLIDLIEDQSATLACNGEYMLVCPECKDEKERTDPKYLDTPYVKKKLYIDEGMSVGYCFRCNGIFLDKSGISRMKSNRSWSKLTLHEGESIYLPYSRTPPLDEESNDYLINRCPQLYKDIDLKVFGIYPTSRKLVIKFLLRDFNYYYQLRFLYPDEDNEGNRYYSPYTGDLGKPIYYALGQFNPYLPTVLVEGVFTAISEKLVLGSSVNVVALLGHSITEFQINMLQSRGIFDKIYVHMDETGLSKSLARRLKGTFPRLQVIPSLFDGLDSEEIIRDGKLSKIEYREYLMDQMNLNDVLRLK